jgi:hypothetical protein
MDLNDGIVLIEQIGAADGVVVALPSADLALISRDGEQHSYEVKVRPTPPTPSVVTRDRERQRRRSPGPSRILYVVPHLSASLRATALGDRHIAVAATDDGAVILDRAERRSDGPEPSATGSRGRKPWGRFALMRVLLRTDEPRSQTALAAEAGIAQQAVALALPKLALLGVERTSSGWTAVEPAGLWDRFMAEYPGPGGLRRRWSGVAPLDVQVERARAVARAAGCPVLLSGDPAADRQAPFRRPVTATLITAADIDLTSRSTLVQDGDETLSVVVPADRTVFVTARAWAGTEPVCTDPVLTAWEVAHSRGADRGDAVEHLKQAVLTARSARPGRTVR